MNLEALTIAEMPPSTDLALHSARSRSVFHRLLAGVRRVSARIYAGLVILLLALVYICVIPWFALGGRLRSRARARAPAGWQRRDDPGLATLERLRSLF
jgi:hypothetical protein